MRAKTPRAMEPVCSVRRGKTPAKGRPSPKRHYRVRGFRDASRGSTVTETLAGGTQLSRCRPVVIRRLETPAGGASAATPFRNG